MPVKILSVDDEIDLELLLTQYFRRQIRKGEYEFKFAHNGLEALTMLLKEKDFDIILSDINMPEMDGLTLLTKINEMQNPALKCIMVSAYGDMGNIRQAMNNGAFDFATKPIDLDDLSVTIEKAIEQITYIKQMQKEHTQLESIKGDLAVAREIQQAILPRIFPPFPENADLMDIAASMNAAKDVGGDFYDFFRIDDDHIGFVIADVSGKGVEHPAGEGISEQHVCNDILWYLQHQDRRNQVYQCGPQPALCAETKRHAGKASCDEEYGHRYFRRFRIYRGYAPTGTWRHPPTLHRRCDGSHQHL